MTNRNPVICAIDKKSVKEAKDLCQQISNNVGMVKLGLEFFIANGPEGVKEISKLNLPIFLDLKLHDIPNTVAQATRSATRLDIDILTIHISGGKDMMKAAVEAAKDEARLLGKKPPLLIGITVLTSMEQDDLNEINVTNDVKSQVADLAKLAKESGMDGVVSSAHEIELIKEICGKDFLTIVPGIRLDSSDLGDQKRVMAPQEALSKGADFLVIGRPITSAKDCAKSSLDIKNSLNL